MIEIKTTATIINIPIFENIELRIGTFSSTSLYCIVIQLDIDTKRAI
jgi:hypothetical protein